ncbi:MAG TPA: hypothetical protein VK722_05525 [Candidatus Aquilonibacter sp.]|nr:hypothetical protein [Candidatus Aquilonibacter sp.]
MKIVSFSGIDGAGKSSQISQLTTWLAESKLNVKLLTFWDDVVAFTRFREFMSYKAFKGDRGVGSPDKPLQRRDKNVSSLPLTGIRFFLYLADAIQLCFSVRRAKNSNADVVIYDRYIYDELANLSLNHWSTKVFSRFILEFTPKPDAAFVVDADPLAAYARKPEYPLEFVRRNREAYLSLAQFSGELTVISPAPVETMQAAIRQKMLQIFAQHDLMEPIKIPASPGV